MLHWWPASITTGISCIADPPQQINCPHITSSSVFFLVLSFSASLYLLSALPAWYFHPQHPSTHIIFITAQNMSKSRSGLALKHLICCSFDALSLDPIHKHHSQREAIVSFCHFQLGLLSFSTATVSEPHWFEVFAVFEVFAIFSSTHGWRKAFPPLPFNISVDQKSSTFCFSALCNLMPPLRSSSFTNMYSGPVSANFQS